LFAGFQEIQTLVNTAFRRGFQMDEPLSPPPAAPVLESGPETPADTRAQDAEARGCFILSTMLIGGLAFSATGPVGALLALFVLLALFRFRRLFARLFSILASSAGSRPAAVPRRFGVGSLLVVTAAMAVFLGAMKSLLVEPLIMGLIAASFQASRSSRNCASMSSTERGSDAFPMKSKIERVADARGGESTVG
jgi:hypothetical protein